jgi:hypothetical protein
MTSSGFARAAFYASLIFLCSLGVFVYGVAVGHYGIWPHAVMEEMARTVRLLIKYGRVVPENLLLEPPADASRERLTVYLPERLNGGYYVFMGWSDELQSYAAWLYSSKQELLHQWPIVYTRLDPDGPRNGSDAPHGAAVLSDGSMLVGFDKGDVLARIDPCGTPIWTKEGVYHHSLERAEDGGYWGWRGSGTAYGHYNVLEKFDPMTGKTLRELRLVEDIIRRSPASAGAFTIRPDFAFREYTKDPDDIYADIFHPNDIEELGSNLAGLFPQFERGDLLLSFRNIHLVAVVDGDTGEMKWASYGPWRFQHDPDFTADGKISVYDNNSERNHSEIIKIDPATREVTNELLNGSFSFYTHSMGKHQYLPNGNVLITVPGEGRIAEVTASGDKIMEFNNVSPISPEFNMHVEDAMWFPSDYFQRLPACPKAE